MGSMVNLIALLYFRDLFPENFLIIRGNHEDVNQNIRYQLNWIKGSIGKISSKDEQHYENLFGSLALLYSTLPAGIVVETHLGIVLLLVHAWIARDMIELAKIGTQYVQAVSRKDTDEEELDSIEKYENTGPFECDDEIENTRITSEASSEFEKSVTKAKFDKSTIWTRINVNMTDKHNKYVIKNNDTIFHEIPDKMYVIRGHDLKIKGIEMHKSGGNFLKVATISSSVELALDYNNLNPKKAVAGFLCFNLEATDPSVYFWGFECILKKDKSIDIAPALKIYTDYFFCNESTLI